MGAKKVSIDNTESYSWGTEARAWHLLNTAQLSVIQERIPPGVSEQLHWHERASQFFYVLQGSLTMHAGDEVMELQPQQGCYIAPGVRHQVVNRTDGDVLCLVISNPHSHSDRHNVEPE